MNMVVDPKSSSDVSSVSEESRYFDLEKEQDLLAVLLLVRQSESDPVKQVSLLNRLLDFYESKNNSGLSSLQQDLSAYGVLLKNTIDASTTTSKSESKLGLSRPVPKFGVSSKASPKEVKKSLTADTKPTPPEPTAPIPKEAEPLSSPEVKIKVVSAGVANQLTKNQTPILKKASTEEKKDSISEATKTPYTPETPPPAADSGDGAPDPATRIKEIKQFVNEKVGNPVNLIDVDNEGGREYMNALLNAMKLINTGRSDEVKMAMDRLEKALQAVEKSFDLVKTGSTKKLDVKNPISSPTAKPTTNPTKEEVKEAVDVEPKPPSKPKTEAPTAKVVADSTLNDKEVVPPELSSAAVAAPKEEPVVVKSEEKPATKKAEVKSAAAALAEEEQAINQKTQAKLVENLEKKPDLSDDPLQAPEVTDGLNQLLKEWNIFKGSGLFGLSSKGMDHPLYKELADLPMAAVITSRFEGSTPAIKQSISAYMNGWHYEQGISHEMDETFEHYLRRVVKTILDRKKSAAKA